jgi:hypothetical protein
MQDILDAFSDVSTTWVLWIAIGLAAVFMIAVIMDWFWNRDPKKKRSGRHSEHHHHRSNIFARYFRRIRSVQRSAKQEFARRRRHSVRRRERERHS